MEYITKKVVTKKYVVGEIAWNVDLGNDYRKVLTDSISL